MAGQPEGGTVRFNYCLISVCKAVDLMEDDGPDTIIIKDETFDDGPGKSKPQVNSSSGKDAGNS